MLPSCVCGPARATALRVLEVVVLCMVDCSCRMFIEAIPVVVLAIMVALHIMLFTWK